LASFNGIRIISLIAIIIIVSSSLGYVEGTASRHTETSLSITTFSTEITALLPVTSTVVSITTTTPPEQTTTILRESNLTLAVPFPSLELSARAIPENITSGENVSIFAEVYNSLPETVAVEAAPIRDLSEAWCPFSSPTALSLYSGRYTFSNITGAVFLLQYNGAIQESCSIPAPVGYTFLPNSDEANLQSMPPNNLRLPPTAINKTTSLEGFWGDFASNLDGEISPFQPFPPGVYTALVSDAWGQETLCYFTVS
jgi:hypothetical protein